MRGGTIALLLAALAGFAGAGPGGVAQARPLANPFLQMGAPTEPPRGFTEMCGARPGLCASFAGLGEEAPVPAAVPGLATAPTIIESLAWWDGAAAPVAGQAGFASRDIWPAGTQRAGIAISAWRAVALSPPPPGEPFDWATPDSRPGLINLFGKAPRAAALSSSLLLPWDLPPFPALAPAAQPLRHQPFHPQPFHPWPGFDARLSIAPALSAPLPRPADFHAMSGPAGPVEDWRKLLGRVNARVNAHVYQQSDLATYGVPELWRPSGVAPGAVGDCEDLALEKRVELLASHFPPDRLFLAVVWRRDVGLHTVLVARLDGGDVVLDSRVDFIERWDRAGYSWVSLETPGRPQEWREAA